MAGNEIEWRCNGGDLRIGLDRAGAGPTVLLLPALSSISTRSEMQPLQERLAQSFTTVAVDWPGFGCRSKPFVDWRPQVYDAFLAHLRTHVVPSPFATIAACGGLSHSARRAAWRLRGQTGVPFAHLAGTLTDNDGGDRPVFSKIVRAVDLRVIGPLLYRLNVNRFMISLMGRGHVYADPAWLTKRRLDAKFAVARTPGARHASVRFVTGRLDPFRSREEQLGAARRIDHPMLILFAENAPPKSKAEMEALTAVSSVQTVRLPVGKLSVYEEFLLSGRQYGPRIPHGRLRRLAVTGRVNNDISATDQHS